MAGTVSPSPSAGATAARNGTLHSTAGNGNSTTATSTANDAGNQTQGTATVSSQVQGNQLVQAPTTNTPLKLVTPEHVPDPRELVLVQISDCESSLYEETQEGKCLVGMLLSLRHYSMNENGLRAALVSSGQRFLPSPLSGSRQRAAMVSNGRTYDRIATFADMREPGRCFARILKNQHESVKFFCHCMKQHEGVGTVFVLEEPDPVVDSLGSTTSVPLVSACQRLLPLKNTVPLIAATVPIESPSMGCTRYFTMHGAAISASMARFQQGECSGTFCDRQVLLQLSGMQKCGCFYTDRVSSYVIVCNVGIPVPVSFDPLGKRIIRNFSSWRTSNLFLKATSWQNVNPLDMTQLTMLRTAVGKVVSRINALGGWTIVGWLRTGSVQDSSSAGTGNEDFASDSQQPHISYLYPTDLARVLADQEFIGSLLVL